MFTNANLSFDAAPPIKVVLRFFLSGAVFGLVASLFAFFNVNSLSAAATPETLTIVHLLTLGVMASFMLGALFQMLPVLAGVSIKSPELISLRVNYALIFGTISLVVSFFNGSAILYSISAISLTFALFATAFIMLKEELIKVQKNASPKGMMLAIISLAVVVILGLLMLALRAGIDIGVDYTAIKNIHLSFGLFGWIAMLIISVSFQVIEMFYVTPPYPKALQNYLTVAIFALLLIALLIPSATTIIQALIALLLAIFAIYTLIRLSQKKRSVSDASLWFWRVGMGALIAYATLFLASIFITVNILLIAILYTFFALFIVVAMVFKIVPFLVWFQLNRAGYFDGPMMHEVIHPKIAKYNFYLFAVSFALLIIGVYFKLSIYIALLALISSFLIIFFNACYFNL